MVTSTCACVRAAPHASITTPGAGPRETDLEYTRADRRTSQRRAHHRSRIRVRPRPIATGREESMQDLVDLMFAHVSLVGLIWWSGSRWASCLRARRRRRRSAGSAGAGWRRRSAGFRQMNIPPAAAYSRRVRRVLRRPGADRRIPGAAGGARADRRDAGGHRQGPRAARLLPQLRADAGQGHGYEFNLALIAMALSITQRRGLPGRSTRLFGGQLGRSARARTHATGARRSVRRRARPLR